VRRSLSAIVLLVDSRLGFTDIDRKLLDFVATRLANGSVKLLALLTKVDKLNRNETTAALKAAGAVLGEVVSESSDVSLTPFSSLSRAGVDDAARVLYAWTHPTP
jgi:GTP-binding protein